MLEKRAKHLPVLFTVVAVLVCLFLLPTRAEATTVASGTYSDNLTWTLDSKGVLTISGTGKVDDIPANCPWYSNYRDIQEIILDNGVTYIGEYTFSNCENLTSVTIPESVTAIGEYAFFNCGSLTNVSISEGITNIGDGAFYSCTSLQEITLPDSLKNLGDEAFYNCSNLSGVVLGNGLTVLRGYTFGGCSGLTNITIGSNVTNIGNYAFSRCSNLAWISFSSSTTTIGSNAFFGCGKLSCITLPATVKSIGDYAFTDCTGLKMVFFKGTEDQQRQILKGYSNSPLGKATWHYEITEASFGEQSYLFCPQCCEYFYTDGTSAIQYGQDGYWGRQALATLPNAGALLNAYDRIAAGIEASVKEISVYDGVNNISQDEISIVMDAYRRDYTQHFWLGNGWSVSYTSETVLSVYPSYTMSGDALTAARTAFDEAVNTMVSGIDGTMSEFDKELYLHDQLATLVTYAESANAHNAYGALVEGAAVCEGYAEALQCLLHQAGIRSFIAIGTSQGQSHAWNIVRIDGSYYHTDLTWNDQGDNLFHAYFNQPDAVIWEDHTLTPTAYILPQCDSDTASYFTVNGGRVIGSEYSAGMVGELLESNKLKASVYITEDVNSFVSWCEDNIGQIAVHAGVSSSFYYNSATLGREVILSIMCPTVSFGCQSFFTISEALDSGLDGYLCLNADLSENLTVSADVSLDLNGYTLTGDITIADGATLYVFDTATADYTADSRGKIVGKITGNLARSFNTPDAYGHNYKYLALEEEPGAWSFHRYYLTVKSVILQPCMKGEGYTGTAVDYRTQFKCNELVAQHVTAYGTKLVGDSTVYADYMAQGYALSAGAGNTNEQRTWLTGTFKTTNTVEENATNALVAPTVSAYIVLDGTTITSAGVQRSLQDMIVYANSCADLTAVQKAALGAMYDLFKDVLDTWTQVDITNIKRYAAESV